MLCVFGWLCVFGAVLRLIAFPGLPEQLFAYDRRVGSLAEDPFRLVLDFFCLVFHAVPAGDAGVDRILQYVFDRPFFKRFSPVCPKPEVI